MQSPTTGLTQRRRNPVLSDTTSSTAETKGGRGDGEESGREGEGERGGGESKFSLCEEVLLLGLKDKQVGSVLVCWAGGVGGKGDGRGIGMGGEGGMDGWMKGMDEGDEWRKGMDDGDG